jgi:hypothetical protein
MEDGSSAIIFKDGAKGVPMLGPPTPPLIRKHQLITTT